MSFGTAVLVPRRVKLGTPNPLSNIFSGTWDKSNPAGGFVSIGIALVVVVEDEGKETPGRLFGTFDKSNSAGGFVSIEIALVVIVEGRETPGIKPRSSEAKLTPEGFVFDIIVDDLKRFGTVGTRKL